MAIKKPFAGHENIERWMVSYADFMTLMFAVFVVLYSFAMTKQSEAQSMVQGLVQSFNEIGMISSTQGVIALPGPIAAAQTEAVLATASANAQDVNADSQGGGGVMDFGVSAPVNESLDSEEDPSVEGNLTQSELETQYYGRKRQSLYYH